MTEIQRQRERLLKTKKPKGAKKITPMRLKDTYKEVAYVEEKTRIPVVEETAEEEYLLPEEERERERPRKKSKITREQKERDIVESAADINRKIKASWRYMLSGHISEILSYILPNISYEDRQLIGKTLYTYLDFVAASTISDREDNRESNHIHIVQQYLSHEEVLSLLTYAGYTDYDGDHVANLLSDNFYMVTESLEGMIDKWLLEYQQLLDSAFAEKPRPANVSIAIMDRKKKFLSRKIRELDHNAYLRAIKAKMIRPGIIVEGFEPPEKIEYEMIEPIEHPELEGVKEDIFNVEDYIGMLEEKNAIDGLDIEEEDELEELYEKLEELFEERKEISQDLIRRGY